MTRGKQRAGKPGRRREHDTNTIATAKQRMAELGIVREEDLLEYCRDPRADRSKRAKACVAAAVLLGRAAIPVLSPLATDDNSGVVWGAANGLALVGSRRVTGSLMRFLGISKVEAHRHAAMSALGSIGDPRAEQCLVDVLLNQNESEGMRQWAAEALKGVHRRDRGSSALIKALRDPSPSVRWSVLTTLGCVGDRSALGVVREYLSDQAVVPGLDPEEATVAFAAGIAVDNLTRMATPARRRASPPRNPELA